MMAERNPRVTGADRRDATTARRCQEPSRLVGGEELRAHKAEGCG